MSKIALLFPGQGAQRVGMGLDLLDVHPWLLDRYYTQADDILGFPLSRYCFSGPAAALARTEITQPAVFLQSVAVLDVLLAAGVEPDVVAGHSLGEYTAAVAAGIMDWRDGLRLVRRRGELMAEVNSRTPGTMTAILGLPYEAVAAICAEVRAASGQVVDVANDNDPGQVVVSGCAAPVAQVAAQARRQGAQRVVTLDVGGAFHSRLMDGVERQFSAELDGVTVRDPALPMVANVTATYVSTAADALACLRRQLTGSVRWTDTLRLLERDGVTAFVEVGPGRVLSGFCRATCPDLPVHATSDVRRLARTTTELGRAPAVGASARRWPGV